MPLTIGESVDQLRSVLRDYIEATYHISHPAIVEQRRDVLDRPGVIHQRPFLESTPQYQAGRKYGDLGLPGSVEQIFRAVSKPKGELDQLIYDPPYEHQAASIEKCLLEDKSLVVMTGTGSGKTECFLLPILGKLAIEASTRGKVFGQTAAIRQTAGHTAARSTSPHVISVWGAPTFTRAP